MDHQALVGAVRRYLKHVYTYRVNFGLSHGKPVNVERRKIIAEALPGVDPDILEILFQQMYEDGQIVKDDGQMLHFSVPFVFN